MAANTLSILKPSVNNLTARIFVRAAGLDFEEVDVWGKKDDAGVPRQGPGPAHADARGGGAAAGLALGELRDHAVPLQQARARRSSTRPTRASGRWSTARCSTWSARSIRSSRAPPTRRSASRSTRARSRPPTPTTSSRRRPSRTPRRRSPSRSRPTARSSSTAGQFIGGDAPSIADIRLAATLEFLRAIDYDFPAWAEEYMAAVEAALGDAYSEPAADVRGFVAGAKS